MMASPVIHKDGPESLLLSRTFFPTSNSFLPCRENEHDCSASTLMAPPTPRIRTIPLPHVTGNPPLYSPVLPSPPTSSSVDLNPLLRPSHPPKLYFDVTRPPCTIIFHESYTPFTLSTPATTPSVTHFRIIPTTTPLWPVMVFNPRGVTVFDVLDAIYHSLHAPVSSSAWDDIDLPFFVPMPSPPLRSRSHDLPRTPPSTPSPEGRRRVDYFRGQTMFSGLEKAPGGPESWILHTTTNALSE